MTEQERLHAFVSSIREKAERESSAIRTDTKRQYEQQMEQVRSSLAEERKASLLKAYEESRKTAGDAISEEIRASRSALAQKQLAIREDVFSKVEARLTAFVASEEYLPFLRQSASRICARLTGQGIRVFLSPRDLPYQAQLKECFPENTAFFAEEAIRIGGLRAYTEDGSICADDTLDKALKEQKRNFAQTSGLDVS